MSCFGCVTSGRNESKKKKKSKIEDSARIRPNSRLSVGSSSSGNRLAFLRFLSFWLLIICVAIFFFLEEAWIRLRLQRAAVERGLLRIMGRRRRMGRAVGDRTLLNASTFGTWRLRREISGIWLGKGVLERFTRGGWTQERQDLHFLFLYMCLYLCICIMRKKCQITPEVYHQCGDL